MHIVMRRRPRGSERGAVAIITALSMVALCAAAAMVLDFGILRVDQQVNKSAADAATSAGLRGLDQGDGRAHPYAGVCQALDYLKANLPQLSDMTSAWENSPYSSPCSGASGAKGATCTPGDDSTWADFTGTSVDAAISVKIQSGYLVSEGDFPEEDLPVLQSDTGDAAQQGCDQLAVIITQIRSPGLGAVATSGDLSTRIRSVGRITMGEKGQGAVALLMLEPHNCGVLSVADQGAEALVDGNGTVPGLIMADSDGTGNGCTSKPILYSNVDHGIVAGPAEAAAAGTTEPLPGVIGVKALQDPNFPTSEAYSAAPNVCPEGADTTCQTPIARDSVGRSPVDDRYLSPPEGVNGAAAAADAVFNAGAAPSGWISTGCTPSASALAATSNVYVACPGKFTAAATFQADTIAFTGEVDPSTLNLPNASHVYIYGGGGTGMKLGNSSTFQMHTAGQLSGTSCTDSTNASRAVMVVRSGMIAQSGGTLRLCHTSVILEGGYSGACLPATHGTLPTSTPCNGTAGNGFVQITGGAVDWTAPNAYGQMTADEEQPAWDQLEDLALWGESAGGNSDWKLSGGGAMHLSGVFMVPNANPFNIHGGGGTQAENCQYISRTLSLTGNGVLEMKPNPYDVVTIPIIGGFSLVR